MSSDENGSEPHPSSNAETWKQELGRARTEAKTEKLRLEAREIRERLNRKWYDIRTGDPKLISTLVAIALGTFIGVCEPIRELELRRFSLINDIHKAENTKLRDEVDQLTRKVDALNTSSSDKVDDALGDAASRAAESQSVWEKLSGEYKMLAKDPGLGQRDRDHLIELAKWADERVKRLEQEIRSVRAAQEETRAQSKRITEELSTLTKVRTILITVLDVSQMPLSGIYLNRIISGGIKAEPLEYSTDSRGQRYIQVWDGDKICTQETDEFVSTCRTIEPHTRETTLILERK